MKIIFSSWNLNLIWSTTLLLNILLMSRELPLSWTSKTKSKKWFHAVTIYIIAWLPKINTLIFTWIKNCICQLSHQIHQILINYPYLVKCWSRIYCHCNKDNQRLDATLKKVEDQQIKKQRRLIHKWTSHQKIRTENR